MLRKSNILAIAATAALGLAMLSASEAGARGFSGGGGMRSGGGGMHFAGGLGRGDGGRIGHWHPYPHPHWHVRYHHPIWVGGVRTAEYSVARPVAGPCTCLSKEYTPDGRVLFKDVCTNEAAMNPPIVSPQQTGALDAPEQQASNAVQYQATPSNALPQVDPTTGLPK